AVISESDSRPELVRFEPAAKSSRPRVDFNSTSDREPAASHRSVRQRHRGTDFDCRSTTEADQERYTASQRKVWRRAGDSNSETPCGVVDFKSTALPVEASPPGPARQELTIHHQAIRTMSPPCKLVTG